jgi:hypothetical protein
MLVAPLGPGVYELRLGKKNILVGIGVCCAARMTSLLPSKRGGSGVRNNNRKREFVYRNLGAIEYRTCACASRDGAARIERELLDCDGKDYEFET